MSYCESVLKEKKKKNKVWVERITETIEKRIVYDQDLREGASHTMGSTSEHSRKKKEHGQRPSGRKNIPISGNLKES